ncbi:MAG: hypothetical protein GXP21_01585 [Gammaproteobacteria bacterium]|nr:hypothetical protein [Gammaproteobacteria bacterium]
MEERTFRGILIRFSYAILWCFALGVVLGLLYKLPYHNLQETVKSIVTENSAPKSFHLISVFSIISIGLLIVIAGRTSSQISTFRNIIGYKAAEVALVLAAVFYGLLFGFSCAIFEWPLLAIGFYAFLVTAGILLVLLWLSFEGNGVDSETLARIYSAILILIAIGVTWYVYFR